MRRFGDKRKSEEVRFRKLQKDRAKPTTIRQAAKAAAKGEIVLDVLRLDGGTQSRAVINAETVEAYAELMATGVTFPPITVFYDGASHWLVDGFHRVTAAKGAGLLSLPADVRQGTLRDAILYSVGVNGTHGLQRSNSDKRRAVERLLRDEEWAQWSNAEIGRRAHVTAPYVGRVRASISPEPSSGDTKRQYVNKHGDVGTMDVSHLGPVGGRTNVRDDALPQTVIRPSLPTDAPAELQQAVDAGRLSPMVALHMWGTLQRVHPDVRSLALALPLDGSERINILAGLHSRRHLEGSNATFDEIGSTGGFQHGENLNEWIDFCAAPLRAVDAALKSLSKHHAQIAAENQQQERVEAAQTAAPDGKHRCLVIDPPWPMKFIERDVRPAQGLYPDYPTMTLDQIERLPVADLAHEDGCHLYLWTTQKFLPDAIRLVEAWGFTYQCLLTWVKPGGMTPYSWMYNTEHVIFARRGNVPLLKFGEKLSFEAPATGHSIKPEVFYQRVVRVSPGPRLDMFARQGHEGFATWGFEAPTIESEVSHDAVLS